MKRITVKQLFDDIQQLLVEHPEEANAAIALSDFEGWNRDLSLCVGTKLYYDQSHLTDENREGRFR